MAKLEDPLAVDIGTYSFRLIDLPNNYNQSIPVLAEHIKSIMAANEKHHSRKVEKFYIGKSYVHQWTGRKFDHHNPRNTWVKKGIINRWSSHSEKGFNAMAVLTTIRKESLSHLECHANAEWKQQYALSLEQALISHFMFVEDDPRLENKTTEPGNLEKHGAIAYVLYLALKFHDAIDLSLSSETTTPPLQHDITSRVPSDSETLVPHKVEDESRQASLCVYKRGNERAAEMLQPLIQLDQRQVCLSGHRMQEVSVPSTGPTTMPTLNLEAYSPPSPSIMPCVCGSTTHQRTVYNECPYTQAPLITGSTIDHNTLPNSISPNVTNIPGAVYLAATRSETPLSSNNDTYRLASARRRIPFSDTTPPTPSYPQAYSRDPTPIPLVIPFTGNRRCKCGSTTHLLITHHECPLRQPCKCGSFAHQRTNHHECPLNQGIKPCKCGSFAHQRTNHHECPLNQGIKPCKCGSFTHQRTNHHECPLNRKK